jgi:hypothetical protein
MGLNDTSNLRIADSAAGTVMKLNVTTAAYEMVIRDLMMANLPTRFIQVAIDGVYVYGSDLFYTSLNRGLFAKIPISLITGPAEIIANDIW